MTASTSGLLDTLKRVVLSGHQQHGSVEVFHLRWPAGDGLDYATLDEALQSGEIEITEISEQGHVPKIKIVNRSARMVLLIAGEQVVGCKQNRVMNASMMVPAKSEMPIPVTCVESGRWGYRSPAFTSGDTLSHSSLRSMMSAQSLSSYKRSGVPISDQSAVWREVSRKIGAMKSYSESDSLQDVFHDYDAKLKDIMQALTAPTDCNGAVFVVGGRIAGADFFDKPETLRKLWPKLVKSCAIDALEPSEQGPASPEPEAILSWLQSAAGATAEAFPSPGAGEDVRIEGENVLGASLVVEDHPVHMELFRRAVAGTGSTTGS